MIENRELMDTSDANALVDRFNGHTIDYKNILNSITEGIYAIDQNGICLYCNSSCQKMLDYCSDELLGKNVHDLIHYSDANGEVCPGETCKIIKASIQGIETYADDEVFWKADGTPIPVAYYAYPQFEKGTLSGAVVVFSDISEEKKQLGKLEASEAKYRNIFRNANAGIIYVDENGYTISANGAFQELVQYSLRELQQLNFQEIVYKEDWEKEIIFRKEILEGKRDEYRMEKRYVRKDGRLIWANVSVSSYKETPSSPLYYLLVVHDINDKKEYEQQLLQSNAGKDKFFSIIAHDLRNPVGAIKMLCEFIQDELKVNNISEVSELSGMLTHQVNHTYTLLNDLLDWSRAQTKQISFNPMALNIYEVIAECVDRNLILAKNKNIEIENVADKQLMVTADLNMLDTVLRNLITNAIKFSYHNGKIILTARERTDDILITVEDSGRGISPAILKKLFLIGSKTSTPGTNNEGGTGLGLLLSKEFIERHGGSIWAESEIGSGSRFFFTLPKLVVEA